MVQLPAIFPDGTRLDRKAYPWLVNGLVSAHFRLLREKRPPLSRLQTGISILLVWWLVPGTLLLVWGRFLPRHDWIGTGLHVALLLVSVLFGIVSYRLARVTLRGQDWKPILWQNAFREGRFYAYCAATIVIFAVFSLISFGAIEGVRPHPVKEGEELMERWRELLGPEGLSKPLSNPDVEATDIRSIVPRLLAFFGYRAFADLTELDVSTKPANWTRQRNEIALVKGARLKGRDLRYAMASRAFLVNADLRGANLRGADLDASDMREANLASADLRAVNLFLADLRGANFAWAILRGARLHSVQLQGASFLEADLQDADFGGADLRGAMLGLADLKGVRLERAKLHGADLRWAKWLTVSQVKEADGWEAALYTDSFLQKLGLPPDHNERIEKKLAERGKANKATGAQ